jgi:hypothetical protein
MDDIEEIKALITTVPGFEGSGYRWPFKDTVAKFVLKNGLEEEFKSVWEVRSEKLVHNIDSRKPVSTDRVKRECRILVEYSLSPYQGKLKKGDNEGFSPSCSLKLYSIGILEGDEEQYGNKDFQSLKKKKRMNMN